MNRLNIFDDVTSLAASTTLGYGPGQTIPASLMLVTAAATITLPPILTSTQTVLPGLVTEGCGSIEFTIRSAVAGTVVLAAASGDTLNDSYNLSQVGSQVTLKANPADRKWYRTNAGGTKGYRTVGTGGTLTANDQVVSIQAAGTTTMPAPATLQIGQPLTIYNVAASQTLAPASGENFNGAANITLGALGKVTLITDGTNWLSIA
jgi:hypothetical protein